MIFQHTIDSVLSGRKTQTRRLWRTGEMIERVKIPGRSPGGVLMPNGRYRWEFGKEIAVQPGRGKPAIARIEIRDIFFQQSALQITESDARAEGFQDAEDFRRAWCRLHGRRAAHPVWVLVFRLVPASVFHTASP